MLLLVPFKIKFRASRISLTRRAKYLSSSCWNRCKCMNGGHINSSNLIVYAIQRTVLGPCLSGNSSTLTHWMYSTPLHCPTAGYSTAYLSFFLAFFLEANLEIRQNIGLYVVRAPHQFLSTVVMIHTKLISNGFVYHRTMQFFAKIFRNEILRIYRILCKYLFFITELRRFFSWELNPNCKLDCRRSCQGNVTILSRHD